MKKSQTDKRIKAKRKLWLDYTIAYMVLLMLSTGQGMILAEYMGFDGTFPAEYIFGIAVYWAIVAAVFILITHKQTSKRFDIPMQRLIWRVLELVGGDITVHSEVGKGTTFTVKLAVK